MIGESPYTKTKTLNFVIVRSDSPRNLLIERIGMQKMGIVVSRIHVTVKFHTPYGIGTVSSTYESNKVEKWQKKVKETISEATKDVLSCLDAKERIIINDRYPEQTVFIGKISRTIKVGRKLFNTENKMNEYKHIKPVKQKMRGLGLDHNEATCKEVDELTKAGIIQKVKDQTWVANLVMRNIKKCKRGMEDGAGLYELKQGHYPKDGYSLTGGSTESGIRFCVRMEVFLGPPRAETKVSRTGESHISPCLRCKKAPKDLQKKEHSWKTCGSCTPRGASSSDGSGADLMLVSPEGKEYTYALRFEFETTNNEAEYEALLAGLRIVEEMEIKNLVIYIYSQVVVNQVKGLVEARQHVIKQYLKKMKEILKSFDTYSMEYIRRNQNKKTDALSKMAFVTFEHLTKEVLVEVLANRSINSKEVSTITADTEEN
ncbi:reverse transcriptase domain-containing protein [Tanacetum coccineum]|uniref:Reverse transcriptase domain-containing protein n=1 Tax=Tanacetum coccineum TaxID=301880 RepID=A0ABQ5A0H4_9ASTR